MPPHRADDGLLPGVRGGTCGGAQAGPAPRHGRRVMAIATAQYCGRCGASLAPGTRFCGRCGTPVSMQAYAAPRAYSYAPAPRTTYPSPGQPKLAPAFIAGGLIIILVVVAAAVGLITIARFTGGQHGTCTSNCAPKSVTPLPEQASYRSSR